MSEFLLLSLRAQYLRPRDIVVIPNVHSAAHKSPLPRPSAVHSETSCASQNLVISSLKFKVLI